jgi:hypothetical protein
VTGVYGPQLPDAADVNAAYAAAVAAEDPAVPDTEYEAALDAWEQTENAYFAAHPGGQADQTVPTRTAEREPEAGQ